MRLALLLAALPAASALGQTAVDPAHKFVWQENTGWTNWADAAGGAQSARVSATFLSGFVWSENAGWISLGDGTPGGGANYTNASGSDAGVNIAADGHLSGFAWGENIGWINFDTLAALGSPQCARLDRAAGRFRGWAWGENVGWINLDDPAQYIALVGGACYANCDASTTPPILNVADFACFLNRFAAGASYANCDGSTASPVLNVADFACFLNQFAAGCN
jgi:hypothetical protein